MSQLMVDQPAHVKHDASGAGLDERRNRVWIGSYTEIEVCL